MRVALVHDWLTGWRGGEKVLHELCGMFPDADLYTLIWIPGTTSERIESRTVHASGLSRLPGVDRHYRKLLPLFPSAIERFELRGYDLVVSTSHSFAKGVRSGGAPHLCYCFTPIRYVWDQIDAYLGRGAKRALATPLVSYLRRWDVRTSTPERVSRFVGISEAIVGRIRSHYGRDAGMVYPNVEVARFAPSGRPADDFFFLLGGFVPYKREDLAIEAFRSRPDLRLVIAGEGPTRARLQAGAPPNVEFLGRIDDAELGERYARCRALIYPQEEDFGIIAVEAQAAGRPVIAFGRGGAAETVVPFGRSAADPTGVWFDEPVPASLVAALERFESVEKELDPAAIRRHAERFSPEAFRRGLRAEIDALLASR